MSDSRLEARLAERIRAEGPISLAAFMAVALHDPQDGYYARRAPIGAAGDFVTAPEISQIFGELIGVWSALVWQRMGRPDPVILAELGPGRGTLMVDLLRAAAALPEFRSALRLHLVEASPVLRAVQRDRLAEARPVWVEQVADLPPGPLLLIANEFLDALPIRQFVRTGAQWAERQIGLDAAGRLAFVSGAESPAAGLLLPESVRRSAAAGVVAEICPAALALAASLGRRFAETPGAALFIDYGRSASAPGESLRALLRHRLVPVLAAPGCADLSADVDFAAFLNAARESGAAGFGPVPQARFLAALGAEARLAALAERATLAQRTALETGLRRLVDPAQMGALYQTVALLPLGTSAPPGFEDGTS